MDDYTRQRLRESIAEDGMVGGFTWNDYNGHMVGGHQRLMCLDELEGSLDYWLDVDSVHIEDMAAEVELNARLNNAALQGIYDNEKLYLAMTEHGGNPFHMGFETLDLQLMFAESEVTRLLEIHAPEELELEAPGEPDADVTDEQEEKIENIKAMRAQHKSADAASTRQDHIIVLVFENAAQADAALAMWKLPTDTRFHLAGRVLATLRDRYREEREGIGARVDACMDIQIADKGDGDEETAASDAEK